MIKFLKFAGYLTVGLAPLLLSTLANAQGFDGLETAADDAFDIFDGAKVALVAVAIIVSAIGMAFQWMGLKAAGIIVGASVVIAGAQDLAELFVGG